MPKFLIQVNFNQEAAKRLIEDGGTRERLLFENCLNNRRRA